MNDAGAVCCCGGGVLPRHDYVSENTGTNRVLEALRVTWLGMFGDKTEVRKLGVAAAVLIVGLVACAA